MTLLQELEIDARAARCRAKFTILSKLTGNWTDQEIQKLRTFLTPTPGIRTNPEKPRVVILSHEWSRECCRHVLKHNDFAMSIITGGDNPALPFPIPNPF
jgi:hypothetical protein